MKLFNSKGGEEGEAILTTYDLPSRNDGIHPNKQEWTNNLSLSFSASQSLFNKQRFAGTLKMVPDAAGYHVFFFCFIKNIPAM